MIVADSASTEDLTALDAVDSDEAEALQEEGFESIADVQEADVDDLTEAEGVDEDLAEDVLEQAEEMEESASEDDGGEDEETDDEAGAGTDGGGGSSSGAPDLMQIQERAEALAQNHIDEPFDGIIEIGRHDDGWYAVVEVIEREAVPDTQDILGQYEIELDGDGSVTAFRLLDRYRRGDVRRDNPGASREVGSQQIE